MYGMDAIKIKKCSKCGEILQVEGVDVEVGYYYPTLICNNCGWSEDDDIIVIGADKSRKEIGE